MKEENKKYADEAYAIVEHAANEIGSRLPGSDGERKFHDYMAGKLSEIGIKPVKEEFAVSPRGSIGGIPYAGWAGVIIALASYAARAIPQLWIPLAAFSILTIIWLVWDVFFYHTTFDMFFKQEISRNTWGELVPEDGKYDYTIVLSGHSDTSWNWKHSEHSYKYRDKPVLGLVTTYAKVGFGAVCFFVSAFYAIFEAIFYLALNVFNAEWALKAYYVAQNGVEQCAMYGITSKFAPVYSTISAIMLILGVVCAFGCFFVTMWCDADEKNASRGAMDNATGIALAYETIKYFKENPEKLPKGCRIVDLNCGSEEAGLRGSMAFAEEHKNDEMLKNCWNLNIDSIADKEYFEVVIKDDWQGCRFDTDLEQMFKDSFNELGIESKTNGCIHNPVGGCDSTPMTRAGVKSVTFAAQNPILTNYYHTWRDVPQRFEVETVGTGFDVLLSVIDKIAAFQEANGYNGPQK